MKVVSARVEDDLARWIDEEFPHGFKQTFIEQCFVNLRRILTEGKIPPPAEYARLASLEATAEMASWG